MPLTEAKNPPAELRAWLDSNAIEEIDAVVADMTGVARGKILPAKKYCENAGLRLPASIFAQTVNGDYPRQAELDEALGEGDGDMLLAPDIGSARLVPLLARRRAVLIHDCFHFDRRPVEVAPRYVLQRVLRLYAARGWRPVVAPEMEFYLVKPNVDSDYPLEPPPGRSGRAESGRQAFSIDAVNEFEQLFQDLHTYCEAQDIGVETLIHEAGAAQMEVNLLHGDALALADQVFLFKRALRAVAMRHKIYGTFMAAPLENQPGSAMHLHLNVFDADGRNLFSEAGGAGGGGGDGGADGGESVQFRHFIGGLQKYLPAALAFCAPNVNSYRRLGPDEFGVPVNVEWGYDNRAAGLRVPVAEADARRVENRVCGADVNPYLAIAAALACGYLGLREEAQPRAAVAGPPPAASPGDDLLPHTLREAVAELLACRPLHEVLGGKFVRLYSAVKRHEYHTFLKVISAWEREHLLLNV